MRPEDDRGAAADDLPLKGAGDGPIEIVEYEASWPAFYIAERERLVALLPGLQIHHIGSTAVPGLAAKSVIDMVALVDDLEANIAAVMKRASVEHEGELLPAM